MSKLWFIIPIFLLIIVIIVVYMKFFMFTPDKDGMTNNIDINISYCSYTVSGDDMGSFYNIEYLAKDNIIKITSKKENGSDKEIETYEVKEEKLKNLYNLIYDSDYKNWNSYKNREEYALDASTNSILVVIDDKNYYIDNNKEIPKKEIEIIHEIYEALLDMK